MEQNKSAAQSIKPQQVHRKSGYKLEKVMVIVDDQHLEMLEEIMQNKEWNGQVVYILSDSAEVREKFHYRSRVYSLKANVKSLLRYDIVDEIVYCASTLPRNYIYDLSEIAMQFGVSLLVQPNGKYTGLTLSESRFVGDFLFYVVEMSPRKRFDYSLKTLVESVFAALALFILSPLLLIIVCLIKLSSDGPVIFKQQRVGLRGRKFYIYKFRTMVADAEKMKASLSNNNEADGPAFKIKNDPRITSFGKLLRKTGLDEIPQLFNVILGEMSLIGPRPMLPEEASAQDEWQVKRICIKPGITCTWQIHPNRNKVPFERWMQLDKEYVENWSLGTDVKIFFQTIKSMFAPTGL